MPYSLAQLEFLGVHLGVAIPPDFIENKRREEICQRRSDDFAARAGEIKQRGNGPEVLLLLDRARAAASTRNFAEALRLFDEAEERLKQPDLPAEVLAALKELAERLRVLETEITQIKALESPVGNELKSGLAAVTVALKDRKAEVAEKRLGELEQTVKAFKQQKLGATATAGKAQEIEQARLKERVTQKTAAVGVVLTDIQKVIDTVQAKPIKDRLTARLEPLNQERTRITTLTAPDAQEAALTKLESDAQLVKKEADDFLLVDKWLTEKWEKDCKNVKSWIDSLKQVAAKGALKAEYEALLVEKTSLTTAGNFAAIQKTTHPKLIKVYQAARQIPQHEPKVDQKLHDLRNLVIAVRDAITKPGMVQPILDEFNALNREKKTWPVGGTAAELLKGMDDFNARLVALQEEAEAARSKFLGGDIKSRAAKIEAIQEAMTGIDEALTGCEGTDWDEVAKQPPEISGPLLKMKTEFEAARKTYTSQNARLKKMLPWVKKNPPSGGEPLGRDLVKLGKEVADLSELVIRRSMKLMAKLEGPEKLDEAISELPNTLEDPIEIAGCKAMIEARFGIKIEVGQEFKAKSLPRLGKMLARVPEWHVKQAKVGPDGTAKEKSLKTLSYGTEPKDKGNYYSGNRKAIALQSVGERGEEGDADYTLVADSGKAVKASYFDFTTLHEVGHAVDDRVGFMRQRMNTAGFGDWKKESLDSVVAALLPSLVADCTGGTKKAQPAEVEALLRDLLKTGKCTKPASATDKLGSLFAEWDQIESHPVVTKCKAGIKTTDKPWNKGKAHAESVEVGGRVYQEAYDNDWVSYSLADRAKTGVTKYQWRAPGEWFADLYAMFYMNKLSRSHPMSTWFRKSAKSEEAATKV